MTVNISVLSLLQPLRRYEEDLALVPQTQAPLGVVSLLGLKPPSDDLSKIAVTTLNGTTMFAATKLTASPKPRTSRNPIRNNIHFSAVLLNTNNWKSLLPEKLAFIAGKWVPANSGKTFKVFNPANGQQLQKVPDMGQRETESAIESAREGQCEWASRSPNSRARSLNKLASLIRDNSSALASLITAENGKTIFDAKTEVTSGAASLDWYAEEARRVYGQLVPSLASGTDARRQWIQHHPVGVVGVITPWNFPFSMITRKAGAALAAGCSVVLKPAEDTPLSALALTRLAVEGAGLPPSLLHCVTGSRASADEIGRSLCSHPDVRLIGFTGSTAVGQMLYTNAAASGKRVLLELGGNAPFIVFESADIDKAVAGLIASKFRCSGQTCVSANRIFVHDSIYDTFTEKLVIACSKLRVGDGADPSTSIGPLISSEAVNKVTALVDSSIQAGAKPVLGGTLSALDASLPSQGCFYPPTVLTNCDPSMACMQNEIFGPVAPLCRFRSETGVVQLANACQHGLAAYLYTSQAEQAWRVSDQLEVGMVGINSGRVSMPELPFGGVKASGLGREGGPGALLEFMNVKTVGWDLF